MLIDREAIVSQDNAWVARQEITADDIPDNLQGLLLARIDRLPTERVIPCWLHRSLVEISQ